MFELISKSNKKRKGKISTPHGDIFTPAFGPDATRGAIKSVHPTDIFDLQGLRTDKENIAIIQDYFANNKIDTSFGAKNRFENYELQFILSNTYHLRSYFGDVFIKERGGLHKFMLWPLPILTDSGGFQVFSLIHGAKNLKGKVTDDGAYFNNPINGDRLELTPEKAIDIQFNLGSDIMVTLDDCRHYKDDKELKASVYRTIEWAKRCKSHFIKKLSEQGKKIEDDSRPQLFCVVQGGIDFDLRKYCVEELVKIGFDGYGFGGWAINEKEYFPYDLLEFVADLLPEDKPRYAMGVGNPENIKTCIEYGYDLFDCVIPSRNARHGLAYTTSGEVRIKNSSFSIDDSSLDSDLMNKASQYSKSYIYNLFKTLDPSGGRLLTIQNLQFFNYICNKSVL